MFDDQNNGMPVYRPPLQLLAIAVLMWAIVFAAVTVAMTLFQ
jgi:hypothetical protein